MTQDIVIEYNSAGHPCEFTINVAGFGVDNYLPAGLASVMARELGDEFNVESRGSRLEVISDLFVGDGSSFLPIVSAAACAAVVEVLNLGAPSIRAVVHPYIAPVAPLRPCICGCGRQLTMREIIEHRRALASV